VSCDLIIDTPVGGEPPSSPRARAHVLADAELRARATVDEVAWLHAHPLLWLRVLRHFQSEVQEHIARERRAVKEFRREELARAGEAGQPSEEYFRLAAEAARRNEGRMHFESKLKRRIADVEVLCGDQVDMPLAGEVVGALVAIAELAGRGKPYADIQALALKWARRLEQAHGGTEQVPDNAQAAPVKISVYGLRAGTVLNCRTCHRGKVDPWGDAPQRCPRCGQPHDIDRDG
jgi:hypothetical protein